MADLAIGPELVGRTVCNPARPEWGQGTVLRVQSVVVAGQPVQRVSVQFFVVGHKQLVVPPARLAAPTEEPERVAGWLDTLAGRTMDDRLTQMPAALREFLGTQAQRLAAMAPLYAFGEEPADLIRWARRQANVADPLTHWSRDELLVAFRAFCQERDADLRNTAALLVSKQGREALTAALAEQPAPIREAMLTALRRPI